MTSCAIYTRKSSEEGLDQDFNSLDAQREACEAYVASQKHEGWTVIPTRYDDGGWSGGSMDRPDLKSLLADIAAGRIDTVVVYKVDRLTRSLSDFARIVELFDRHSVTFVSVTQAFNTTTSMGRLTLNVLLSFAQFEREVTGERIRDKVAASKKRGMWMGGIPPLGYDPDGRTLAVNEAEAGTVRHIFDRYLILKSVHRLAAELEASGVTSKHWTCGNGTVLGGRAMGRGPLRHLLCNRVYVGEITHHDLSWPGLHTGIIDPDTFDAVQQMLTTNAGTRKAKTATRAPLAGRIFDAGGNRMSPVRATIRSGRKYGYYVSTLIQKGKPVGPDTAGRVPANELDMLVLDRLRRWSGRPERSWDELSPLLRKVEVHPTRLVIDIAPDDHADWPGRILAPDAITSGHDDILRIIVPATASPRGGRTWMMEPDTGGRSARPNRTLIAGLHRAHRELIARGVDITDPKPDLANASGIPDPYIRKLCSLAFLAPDIQRTILEGNQPVGLTLGQVMEKPLPLDWVAQRRVLGFAKG